MIHNFKRKNLFYLSELEYRLENVTEDVIEYLSDGRRFKVKKVKFISARCVECWTLCYDTLYFKNYHKKVCRGVTRP